MHIYSEESEELIKTIFFASVKIGEYIFFSHWLLNGLFRFNISSLKLEFVCRFNREDEASNLHYKAFVFDNSIWFIPSTNGKYIAVYDITKNHMRYIELPAREHATLINKFSAFIKKAHDVWLIPDGYDALLHIDCMNSSVEIFSDWPEYISWKHEDSRGFRGATKIGEKIYMYPIEGRHICVFDTSNSSVKSLDIPVEIPVSCRVASHGDGIVYWDPHCVSSIWSYHPQSNEFIRLEMFGDITVENSTYYAGNFVGENLWLMPFDGDKAVVLDIKRCLAKKVLLKEIIDKEVEEGMRYQSVAVYDDGVVFTSDYLENNNVMPAVQVLNDGSIRCLDIPGMDIISRMKQLFESDEYMNFEGDASNCGERIYEYVISKIL